MEYHKTIMNVILLVVIIGLAAIPLFSGINLQNDASDKQVEYEQLQKKYYVQSKDIRDSAPTDSMLNHDLALLEKYPAKIADMHATAQNRILISLFVLLSGIMFVLVSLPMKLGEVMNEKTSSRSRK